MIPRYPEDPPRWRGDPKSRSAQLALPVGSVVCDALAMLGLDERHFDVLSFGLLSEIVQGDPDLVSRVGRRYFDMTGRGMYDAWTTARCLISAGDRAIARLGVRLEISSPRRPVGWWYPGLRRCVLDAGHADGHVF